MENEGTTPIQRQIEREAHNIARYQFGVEDAITRKHYKEAQEMRIRLNQAISKQTQLQRRANHLDRSCEIMQLRIEQSEEEQSLKAQMQERLNALMNESEVKLAQILERHKTELEGYRQTISHPRFGMPHLSTALSQLSDAEMFYAKRGNYEYATALHEKS